MTNNPSLGEMIDFILVSEIMPPGDVVVQVRKSILSSFTQAIERAEPENENINKPDAVDFDTGDIKTTDFRKGYNRGKSDYKQRLLAEVK